MLEMGKSYFEICERLKINPSNLHATIYQMREAGISLPKPGTVRPHGKLTPAQRNILERYARNESVPSIAKALGIGCQTVANHASAGFARLGFCSPGIDRIAKLREYFAKEKSGRRTKVDSAPMTMDDSAFN